MEKLKFLFYFYFYYYSSFIFIYVPKPELFLIVLFYFSFSNFSFTAEVPNVALELKSSDSVHFSTWIRDLLQKAQYLISATAAINVL